MKKKKKCKKGDTLDKEIHRNRGIHQRSTNYFFSTPFADISISRAAMSSDGFLIFIAVDYLDENRWQRYT
jgi:hypothetical protein